MNISTITKVFLFLCLSKALAFKLNAGDEDSDVGLNTIQLIEKYGYVCETHYVTTEDGYILTLHRIPHGIDNNQEEDKPNVLVLHGLMSSSADWVNMGPQRSLGYILADRGYDVWLINARGNSYSKNHTTLDPVEDNEEFYDFSWHEMGHYDLPATIDYILDLKGADDLYFASASQGTTAFFVLASDRPEYNAKIRVASMLAPVALMEHHTNDTLHEISERLDELVEFLKENQIYQLPFVEELRNLGMSYCVQPEYYDICAQIFFLVGGSEDYEQLDKDKLAVIFSNLPSDAPTKSFIHYGQLIKNGGFSYFDYGTEKNLEIYGTETPPAYDLTKITTNMGIYYAFKDGLALYEDVRTLLNTLPNVVADYMVPFEGFIHNDFCFARDVADLVYNPMIEIMENF